MQLLEFITSLSTQDEKIVEQMRAREPGQPPNPDDTIVIDPDIIESLEIHYESFHDAINTKIWASVGRANFRPFNEAREFAHSLKIKSGSEWRKWCKLNEKPLDIPAYPNQTYKNTGWKSMGDWLGTGTIASQKMNFLPFADARAYVRSKNFKNGNEFRLWSRLEGKRLGIPAHPEHTYKSTGWKGYKDWLGY